MSMSRNELEEMQKIREGIKAKNLEKKPDIKFYYNAYDAVCRLQGGAKCEVPRKEIIQELLIALKRYHEKDPKNNDLKKLLGQCYFAQLRENEVREGKPYKGGKSSSNPDKVRQRAAREGYLWALEELLEKHKEQGDDSRASLFALMAGAHHDTEDYHKYLTIITDAVTKITAKGVGKLVAGMAAAIIADGVTVGAVNSEKQIDKIRIVPEYREKRNDIYSNFLMQIKTEDESKHESLYRNLSAEILKQVQRVKASEEKEMKQGLQEKIQKLKTKYKAPSETKVLDKQLAKLHAEYKDLHEKHEKLYTKGIVDSVKTAIKKGLGEESHENITFQYNREYEKLHKKFGEKTLVEAGKLGGFYQDPFFAFDVAKYILLEKISSATFLREEVELKTAPGFSASRNIGHNYFTDELKQTDDIDKTRAFYRTIIPTKEAGLKQWNSDLKESFGNDVDLAILVKIKLQGIDLTHKLKIDPDLRQQMEDVMRIRLGEERFQDISIKAESFLANYAFKLFEAKEKELRAGQMAAVRRSGVIAANKGGATTTSASPEAAETPSATSAPKK